LVLAPGRGPSIKFAVKSPFLIMYQKEVSAYALRSLKCGTQVIEYDFLDEITEPIPCDELMEKVDQIWEDAAS